MQSWANSEFDWQAEREWLIQMPKVELHIHLEGAIPHDALWSLIEKYGGDPSTPDQEALRRKLKFRDFRHFIETWIWKNGFLREYDDFTLIAEAVARDLANQNIRYVEAFYSPGDFARHGLQVQRLTEAVRQGLDRVAGITVRLVADLVRDYGPVNAAVTLQEISEVRNLGVIGIGIGGSENEFPPEPFGEVYEQARQLGLRTSAHAGEAAGPASVWGAIRSLNVDRIGHGTRAIEDQDLVSYLADAQIPVELCPLSNVRTGITPSIEDHPAKHYFDQGMLVCINTDDPKMFHNTLVDEFLDLRATLGMSRNDIRQLILNGISASWLSEKQKVERVAEFVATPSWGEHTTCGR